MPSKPKLILIEFNELTNSLLHRFMDAGALPNFRKFYQESEVFTTEVEDEPLNPWVQWVTVHSGVGYDEHKVSRLSDGQRVEQPAIWDLLSDEGYRVWVCGSMNPWTKSPLKGHLLPDPWSSGMPPIPEGEFEEFYDFVREQVQEHTNENTRRKANSLGFVRYMMGHGLKFRSCKMIGRQLWSERSSKCRWKRAMVMDRLQWDVFQSYYRRYRPDFATFFLNSTAHFQHKYWRHMDPEPFDVKPTESETARYGNAIRLGYEAMDALLGEIMQLVNAETTLMFAAGLSQQPYVKRESTGGKHHYRLRTPEQFLKLFGVTQGCRYEPVMAEQFWLRFDDEQDSNRLADRVEHLMVDGERAFRLDRQGRDLFMGCRIRSVVPNEAWLMEGESPLVAFNECLYLMDGIKSAMHHPEAPLWVRHPDRRHVVHEQHVSLRQIAPSILQLFGVKPPPHMCQGLDAEDSQFTGSRMSFA